MTDKIKTTEFNSKQAPANQAEKRTLQSSFVGKLRKKFPTKLGAAVFALIVLHFAAQLILFRSENESPKIENDSIVEVETKYDVRTSGVEEMPDVLVPSAIPASVQAEPRTVTPPVQKVTVKKKEPAESKAERLRRAERILTGV